MERIVNIIIFAIYSVAIFFAGYYLMAINQHAEGFRAGVQWQIERSEFLDRHCEWRPMN